MRSRVVLSGARLAIAGVTSLVLLQACSNQQPTDVLDSINLAKPGGGGPDPIVDGAVPPEAPQNTTLDVSVLGANFDDGSKVRFLLNGKPTKNIATNSTTFMSTGELKANITIALDAETVKYDIEVTTSRKRRGIGTELFTVKLGNGKGNASAELTVIGGLVTSEPQVVGFKDLRKELQLESAPTGSDPKINLAFNMTDTYEFATANAVSPLDFDPGVCVQSGRGNPDDAQLNALFNQLRPEPDVFRPINFFFVGIDKTVLKEEGTTGVFVGESKNHRIAANPDVDGTTRVFKVVSPRDRQIKVEKSGTITNGDLTFTFTQGNVLLRSSIEGQPHGFNLSCPNMDAITMTLTSQ